MGSAPIFGLGEYFMPRKNDSRICRVVLAGLACMALAVAASAQGGGNASAAASGAAAGAAAKNNTTVGRDMSTSNPEVALEIIRPPEKKEAKAYDAYKAVPATDYAKKIQAGEDFLKTYPKSELARYVYPVLVVCYIQAGQIDKGMTTAQKDFEVNPKDFRTMAVLSQTLARTYNGAAPNADEQLAKADNYGKKALEGVPTLVKPDGVTDELFAQAKADIEAMAHGGVGLVLLQQKKYAEAIPDLQKATTLNTNDQTNFYLLAVASQNSDRFAEAAAAFEKCAALPGNLQETCKSGAAEAKKLAK